MAIGRKFSITANAFCVITVHLTIIYVQENVKIPNIPRKPRRLEWNPSRAESGRRAELRGLLVYKTKGSFTQNPITAYDPAYGQRQSYHIHQENHHRQHRQSGLLKTILSKPEAGRIREN